MTLIEERRSMRAYQPRDIDEETLGKILHAANRAPSAGNLQSYHIVVVHSPDGKRELMRAAVDQQFVAEASVVLVFIADPSLASERYGHRGETLYATQDATIACAYAQLAAHDLGLSACWVGAFRKKDVAEIVGATGEQTPVALLPIGYAAETPEALPRRSLSELVSRL